MSIWFLAAWYWSGFACYLGLHAYYLGRVTVGEACWAFIAGAFGPCWLFVLAFYAFDDWGDFTIWSKK